MPVLCRTVTCAESAFSLCILSSVRWQGTQTFKIYSRDQSFACSSRQSGTAERNCETGNHGRNYLGRKADLDREPDQPVRAMPSPVSVHACAQARRTPHRNSFHEDA